MQATRRRSRSERPVDAITAYYAIFHVPRAEHPTVYRKFERVLRPGGVLLMTVGTSRHGGCSGDLAQQRPPDVPEHARKGRDLRAVGEAGFEISEERTVDDPLGSEALFVFCERRS